jgi:hypothetical protein
LADPLAALNAAAKLLGLPPQVNKLVVEALHAWIDPWTSST